MPQTFNPDDLEQALRAVRESRADAAARVSSPWWYHVWFGAAFGLLTAALAAPTPVMIAVEALFLLNLVLLIQVYRRRTGLWVNGYRKGRTQWVTFPGALGVGAIALAAAWLARRHMEEAGLAMGAVQFVFATGLGFAWDAVYRAEMRGKGA